MSTQRIQATHGFHATMTAQPGKADELVELLVAGAPTNNPSCVLYLVGRLPGRPNVVAVTEAWTSKLAHAENFQSAAAQSFVAKIQPLIDGGARYEELVPVAGMLRVGAEVTS